MEIGRAFGAPAKDPKWLGKVALAAILSLVPVASLAVAGWGMEYLRECAHGRSSVLPSWNRFGAYWFRGLVLGFAVFVFYLPAIAIVLAFGIPGTLLASVGGSGTDGIGAALAGLLVGVLVATLYSVIVSILEQAARTNYAMRQTFAALFNFREIIARVRSYPVGYFTAWAMSIVAVWGAGFVSYALAFALGSIPLIGQFASLVLMPFAAGIGVFMGMGVNALLGQYAARAYGTSAAAVDMPFRVTPTAAPTVVSAGPGGATAGLTGQAAVAAFLAGTIPPAAPKPAPEPEPVSAPETEPAPAPAPKLVSKPRAKPEPAPEPEPESAPAPEPEPAPAPEPVPEPASAPAPEPLPVPEPASAPKPRAKPEPAPERVLAPEPAPEPVVPPLSSASAVRIVLTRTAGPGRVGERWTLPATDARIGRDERCLIAIDDLKASRVHAVISQGSQGPVVADAGSSNGTHLNGEAVGSQAVPLHDGDSVRIGDTVMTVSITDQATR